MMGPLENLTAARVVGPLARAQVDRAPEREATDIHRPNRVAVAGVEKPDPEDFKDEHAAKALEAALNDRLARMLSSDLRLRIEHDESTGKFVYLSVNARTGEVDKQWPSDAVLRLMAFFRELEGLFVDAKA